MSLCLNYKIKVLQSNHIYRIDQLNTWRNIYKWWDWFQSGLKMGRGGKEDQRTPVIYDKPWLYICTCIYIYIHKYTYVQTYFCTCAYKHI